MMQPPRAVPQAQPRPGLDDLPDKEDQQRIPGIGYRS